MRTLRVSILVILALVSVSCSNQRKEWEEALKGWEQAVKERDAIISKQQSEIDKLQSDIKIYQQTVTSLQEAKDSTETLTKALNEFHESDREFLLLLHKISLSELERKTIFIDLLHADDRALTESGPGNIGKYDHLLTKYTSEVIQKHNITQEQAEFIGTEGFVKRWVDRMGL